MPMEPALLRPLRELSEETFRDIVATAAAVAAGRKPKSTPSTELSGSAAWPAHEALVGWFVEAARTGVSLPDARAALASVLPEARASTIVELLSEAQQPFGAALNACGIGFPQVAWLAVLVLGPCPSPIFFPLPARPPPPPLGPPPPPRKKRLRHPRLTFQVIDVQWSRSGVAAASMYDVQAASSLYVVKVTTRDCTGETRTIPFTTSLEGLSGLVATLKSAVKQVERECEGT